MKIMSKEIDTMRGKGWAEEERERGEGKDSRERRNVESLYSNEFE